MRASGLGGCAACRCLRLLASKLQAVRSDRVTVSARKRPRGVGTRLSQVPFLPESTLPSRMRLQLQPLRERGHLRAAAVAWAEVWDQRLPLSYSARGKGAHWPCAVISCSSGEIGSDRQMGLPEAS